MKHLKLALLISAITIFAASCASTNTTVFNGNSNNANPASTPTSAATNTTAATAASPSDEFAAARSTYNATCVRCHKENGEGGAVEFDEGDTLNVPSFKTGHGLTHTDAQFARKIAKGGDGMPAFEKKLTSEQIIGLVRFIRHEFQAGLVGDAPPSPSH
ncbi:MAG TPA: cytochrome c [Pyrinomonadaceae bacterium]|nr:cytochrome c [Pyrinomonadaceae bacterium]